MKREIKFRAKRVDTGEWVYGYYVSDERVHDIPYAIYDLESRIFIAIDPETLCQFTGLKDSNGIDIYEGDVLSYNDELLYQIRFGELSFYERPLMIYKLIGFYMEIVFESNIIDRVPICKENTIDTQIIGNIHDN